MEIQYPVVRYFDDSGNASDEAKIDYAKLLTRIRQGEYTRTYAGNEIWEINVDEHLLDRLMLYRLVPLGRTLRKRAKPAYRREIHDHKTLFVPDQLCYPAISPEDVVREVFRLCNPDITYAQSEQVAPWDVASLTQMNEPTAGTSSETTTTSCRSG